MDDSLRCIYELISLTDPNVNIHILQFRSISDWIMVGATHPTDSMSLRHRMRLKQQVLSLHFNQDYGERRDAKIDNISGSRIVIFVIFYVASSILHYDPLTLVQ